MKSSSVGKAIALALFSVSLPSCGSRSSADAPNDLRAQATDPKVRAFYEARAWQAAWDKKSEKQLLDVLGQAPAHGLKPDMFLKEPLPSDGNDRELALTKVALAYASALAQGYADPAKFGRTYTIPRAHADVAKGLAGTLEQGKLGEWFASLPPQTEEYRALSTAYLHFLQLAAKTPATGVPDGKPIAPGGRDARLPAVAAALVANGYLEQPTDTRAPQRYSGPLVAAVKRLQADYGLKPDGVVGGETLYAINAGPADRARQLAIGLERLRWLDRSPPATRVDVNTAATFLDYWRDGRHADRRRVVVGQPDWETPQIQAPIFQLVANPYWRVPDSILKEELSKKSGAYLARNGFEWRDGRMVQRPGAKNSLGVVKLDMRNGQHIYLHDTPAKALFALPERHRSHGCVRVENALDFALMLAAQDGLMDKFQEAMASGDEKYVKLKTEILVRLMYHTAYYDDGQVKLAPDIYGWDDDVARALGFGRAKERPRYEREGEDVGP